MERLDKKRARLLGPYIAVTCPMTSELLRPCHHPSGTRAGFIFIICWLHALHSSRLAPFCFRNCKNCDTHTHARVLPPIYMTPECVYCVFSLCSGGQYFFRPRQTFLIHHASPNYLLPQMKLLFSGSFNFRHTKTGNGIFF